ncbi:MAG: hypothetical protein B6I22_10850 [Desulfobacteraceae bacterium 4572_123]|nr:MAG: hypothetical protein B6I22_10850 [Desulfobacteraceae bacterium 4572_123]
MNQIPGKKTNGKTLPPKALPRRYEINDTVDGKVLTCIEAPNILVRIESGLTISSSAAHKSSPGTIYLDGAAQCEPFMDHEKQIYNFDHHEGCVRSFTLSTCEQILVMILKGLDLRDRKWNVFANDPDLDTIFAIWLLFNHIRLNRKDQATRRFLFALIRMEGIIDSHGLEFLEISGFPQNLLEKTKHVIDHLRTEEVALKTDDKWDKTDFMEYAAALLHKIDKIIYKTDDFTDFKGIKELARINIANSRIAVVVQSDMGIYEIEPYLNQLYGTRLGLVILKKESNAYTLRLMDPFMSGDLTRVYQRLNFIDPSVRSRTDNNRWGGSADIGGSPRGVDTKLTPREIAQACFDAFQKPTLAGHGRQLFFAAAVIGVIIAMAEACRLHLFSDFLFDRTELNALFLKTDFGFFIALLVFSAFCVTIFPRGRFWRYGINFPTGKDWWMILPVMMLAAYAGGIYVPERPAGIINGYETVIYFFIAIPLSSELLFRSLGHGILTYRSEVQNAESPWFFSYANGASAVLYAAFIAYLNVSAMTFQEPFPVLPVMQTLFAAFAFGLAGGFVRERSQSIIPVFLFHTIAMISTMAAIHLTG